MPYGRSDHAVENWDDLKILVAIQKFGSMSAAARELGTNVATISRRMSRLGHELGLSPLVKLKGKWVLNPALSDILDHSADFQTGLTSLVVSLSNSTGSEHSIRTRIGAPPFLLGGLLGNAYEAFHASHPDHNLDFQTRTLSDTLGDCDILITNIQPTKGRLIIRRLGECEFNIYRYPDSYTEDGWIGLVNELSGFEPFEKAIDNMGQNPSVRVSTFADAVLFANSSRLPVFLPEIIARTDADLTPLDPNSDPILGRFWLCYHETRKDDQNMADVVHWVVTSFHALCKTAHTA